MLEKTFSSNVECNEHKNFFGRSITRHVINRWWVHEVAYEKRKVTFDRDSTSGWIALKQLLLQRTCWLDEGGSSGIRRCSVPLPCLHASINFFISAMHSPGSSNSPVSGRLAIHDFAFACSLLLFVCFDTCNLSRSYVSDSSIALAPQFGPI